MLQLSDLLHGFDVKPLGDNRFEAPLINHYGQSAPDQENPANAIIGGGQLLGQAIIAATRSQPEKEVKTVHMVFSRAGWGADPLYLTLDTAHAGGSYGTVGITFEQKGRPISKGVVMLTVPDPDLIRHAREMPVMDGPDHADTKLDVKGAWDLGTIAGADPFAPGDKGPPEYPMWVRFSGAPDDNAINQALVAYVTNFHLISAAMRPHDLRPGAGAHRDIHRGEQPHGDLPRSSTGRGLVPARSRSAVRGAGPRLRPRRRLHRGRQARGFLRPGRHGPRLRQGPLSRPDRLGAVGKWV